MKKQRTVQVTPTILPHQVRNLGIIAHVDAGKTTVAERMLLFTGKIHEAHEVHHGGTTMDYRQAEMAHGITISAAATTLSWNDHTLNLIDTPGHIDFNIDVRCALRVLDGAVVVLDAVAGVEPQTETNWRLADDHHVPRILFINKLDRPGADVVQVQSMIEDRLGAKPLLLQWPVGQGHEFAGVIDLLTEEFLTWPDPEGKERERSAVPETLREKVEELRQVLLEALAEVDDQLAERFLSGASFSVSEAKEAIRRGVREGVFVPVLMGSALKNKGVQPLLDAVVDYLPSPVDWPSDLPVDREGVAALAFKCQADQSFGHLTFCRLYAGTLTPGMMLWNPRVGKRERVGRVYRMHAHQKESLARAEAGEIVALSGLSLTRTGDTLCAVGQEIVLENIEVPDPVTSVVLEAADSAQREKLVLGLERRLREDPTLRLTTEEVTGQLLLHGMGELHLQIVQEELERELGLAVKRGVPQVSYRETITETHEGTYRHKKQGGGPGQFAVVTLRVEPLEPGSGLDFVSAIHGGAIDAEYLPAVETGVRQAAASGILSGSPLVDLRVTLLDGQMHTQDSSAYAFQFAAGEALKAVARAAAPVILEPVMRVEVTTPEEHLGDVMGDLSRRRGMITGQRERGTAKALEADVPLAELFGYINALRSLTSGRGSYSMELSGYAPAPRREQERLAA